MSGRAEHGTGVWIAASGQPAPGKGELTKRRRKKRREKKGWVGEERYLPNQYC